MKKLHKITGIVLALILIWMGVSGVILNHRKFFSANDISRSNLPKDYLYDNWNYGFFKGSLKLSPDTVLMYGNEGVWLTDEENRQMTEFNSGIHAGADNRKVCRMVVTPDNDIYCATLYYLYKLNETNNTWEEQPLPSGIDRIADMEVKGDSLLLLTRSEVLLKVSSSPLFEKIQLAQSPDRTGKRSLFRIIWKLHSGELFGTAGKVIVDGFAVLFTFLSITGIIIWLLPKSIRRYKRRKKQVKGQVGTLKFSWKWHAKLGYWFTIPLLIIVISGSFLRPPLLIAIAKPEVTPPPLTTMSSENTWHDQLRVARYDTLRNEWLLYTSDGFFTLKELNGLPQKLPLQPPVSVMGVNVLEQLDEECWVTGSFSGLIIWNRVTGTCIDGFTGKPARMQTGMPFGQRKISGFTMDLKDRTVVFDYDTGAYVFEHGKTFLTMPQEYANRPMSLWNLALEMHTGRVITFLGMANVLFVFVVGMTSVVMIFSGWRVYLKKRKKKSTAATQ